MTKTQVERRLESLEVVLMADELEQELTDEDRARLLQENIDAGVVVFRDGQWQADKEMDTRAMCLAYFLNEGFLVVDDDQGSH